MSELPEVAQVLEQPVYRLPKQARGRRTFEQILQCTERRLNDNPIADFTLNDIADDLNLSVGTVYHFFPKREALLLALADLKLEHITNLSHDFDVSTMTTWQDVLRKSTLVTRDYTTSSKAILTLIYGPACNWEIQKTDALWNKKIAKAMSETLQEIFNLSFIDNLEELIENAIVIHEAFLHHSVRETGTITEKYFELGLSAGFSYLGQFIPPRLTLRKLE